MAKDALYDLIMQGSDEDLRLRLISQPALVKHADEFGLTPLHWLAGEERPQAVQLLVEAGADVLAQDKQGTMPINHARDLATIKILLAQGADVNARSRQGGTPLHHWATEGADTGSLEAMEALLASGADPNLKDNAGKTALDYAMQREEDDKVRLLTARGAKPAVRRIVPFKRDIEAVVIQLVGKSYEDLDEFSPNSRLKASDLAKAIAAYGKTLDLAPQEAYETLDVTDLGTSGTKWSVRMNLWTREDGKSNLTLELIVSQRTGGFDVEIDGLRVP